MRLLLFLLATGLSDAHANGYTSAEIFVSTGIQLRAGNGSARAEWYGGAEVGLNHALIPVDPDCPEAITLGLASGAGARANVPIKKHPVSFDVFGRGGLQVASVLSRSFYPIVGGTAELGANIEPNGPVRFTGGVQSDFLYWFQLNTRWITGPDARFRGGIGIRAPATYPAVERCSGSPK